MPTRAVPPVDGHRSVSPKWAPLDIDGRPIPSYGSGGAGQAGYAHCACGTHSAELPSTRERRLWYTMHREKIVGSPWR